MSDHPTIKTILTGKAVPYTRRGSLSGILKSPCHQVAVTEMGLVGDEQGDPRVHGGPEKAIHHYPFDHYSAWVRELGPIALLQAPGAFGKNLSTLGWTEETVCLGDCFKVGTVTLQISQGRMPCWKLNDRLAVKDMSLRVQRSGRTGWYYRVLEGGTIVTGDRIALVERRYPAWTVARVASVLFSSGFSKEQIEECLGLPLTASWRRTLEKRLEKSQIEDWNPRLEGPKA
ncbi:MOSC domain-containing protein [Pseudomonas sp. 31-12]|uniref:MOSC domain-containing protein n=1 Tax=Pseudomonas sp. 31-12 TaxID=2201356 RepID=UPI000D6AD37D|nr:MOSC domain-containing protein [Pseudomonas sp. 31-12]AWM92533.1 MOSC domain-containing protein [Pseudomonas sp. 31-12]